MHQMAVARCVVSNGRASSIILAAGLFAMGTAASAPPTCTAPPQENICIDGGGKRNLQKKEGTTASACCASCDATAGCTAWSLWEKGDPRGSLATTECGLYAFSSPPTLKPGSCTTGVIRTPAPPPPAPTPPAPPGAKNVLYFIVDDLRTQLGAYGHNTTLTPNLDKLASRGLRFTNAYCQQGVCSPSRNSFMSGRRPDSIKTWTFTTNFREVPGGEDWISFPQHFKKHSYITLGGGKTFHPGHPPNWDEPLSWSQDMPYFPFDEPGCPQEPSNPGGGYIHNFCPTDQEMDAFFDYNLANWTIRASDVIDSPPTTCCSLTRGH